MKNIEEVIVFLKKEQNLNGFNAYDLKASYLARLLDEENMDAIVEAMKRNLLEGDRILDEEDFTVRYYCDNLSEHRRRIYQ